MSTTTRPRQPILLRPIEDSDPRLTADNQSLVLASRNAYPVVATQKKRSDSMGLAAGGAIALLLGGVTFWSMSGGRDMKVAPPPPPAATAPPPTPAMPAPAPYVPPQAITPVQAPLITGPATPAKPAVDGAHSPTMVFDGTQGTNAATVPLGPDGKPVKPGEKPALGGENEQFAARVGGTEDVATAQQLSDPASTVAQGTLIPAVLETAIDTDLPGYVRAVVSRDVRSFDGSQTLIPRSSRLIGQYKSGLQAGQTRAYVIWQRLIRPDGASVALGSPAVDFTGTTGLAGKVDTHFMKRFGSAVLLSVVGGLGAIGGSGTSVILQGGGQSAAAVAAQRDTAIPPTVRVAQGQPIRVFTARDLDFSTVGGG